PRTILIKIKNNSKFEIFDINLEFLIFEIGNYDFSMNDAGLKKFPGKNGTCKRKLAAGKNCTIELQFASIVSGNILQKVVVTYKNLLDEAEKRFNLTVLSGTPASLLFEPNTNNYT